MVFRDLAAGKAKAATNPRVLDEGTVSVNTPPWDGPARVDVVVNTPGVVGPDIASVPDPEFGIGADDFTYVAPEPTAPPIDNRDNRDNGGDPECVGSGCLSGGGRAPTPRLRRLLRPGAAGPRLVLPTQ